jgi:hypothetical protein
MSANFSIVPVERIQNSILLIRGQKVMLDSDLARIYGVTTTRLNEQVKRNRERFPHDFTFQLTAAEKAEVIANCDNLERLKFSPSLPYAFTEHGAIMLASVLNSPLAVQASVQVVRAFVRLRELLNNNKELAQKLKELERKLEKHDGAIRGLFDAIRQLMNPPEPKRRQIGFHVKDAA